MEDLEATEHTVQLTLVEHLLGPRYNPVKTMKLRFNYSGVA